jgi:hypothetical protein
VFENVGHCNKYSYIKLYKTNTFYKMFNPWTPVITGLVRGLNPFQWKNKNRYSFLWGARGGAVVEALRRADNLATFMCRLSWNLEASTSWNPQGLSRPVMGLLFFFANTGLVMSLSLRLYKMIFVVHEISLRVTEWRNLTSRNCKLQWGPIYRKFQYRGFMESLTLLRFFLYLLLWQKLSWMRPEWQVDVF